MNNLINNNKFKDSTKKGRSCSDERGNECMLKSKREWSSHTKSTFPFNIALRISTHKSSSKPQQAHFRMEAMGNGNENEHEHEHEH